MKKRERIVVLILLVITIILVIIGVMMKSNDNKEKISDGGNSSTNNTKDEIPSLDDEFAIVLEDGTRLNTSKELNKTKKFGDIELSDIQLTEKENSTLLLGTLTNKSNTTQGGYVVNISLLDKEGNVLTTLEPYIDEIPAGETARLETSTSLDFANAYNLKIEK